MIRAAVRRARQAAVLTAVAWAASPLAAEFPELTGRVVDQAGVLAPETVRYLSRQLEAHENAGGNQVVVATVASLEGEPIERYGVDLARAWGIGEAERDNGVLLLVAPAEREVRIEVGYGLEGDLPDAIASTIVQSEILPRFRQGSYDTGVAAGVAAIIAALGGEYVVREPPRQRQRRSGGGAFGLIWLVLLGVMFIGRGRGGGLMRGLLIGSIVGSVARGAHGFGGGAGGGFGGSFGGGFSGGGGSFGGGGASGSW